MMGRPISLAGEDYRLDSKSTSAAAQASSPGQNQMARRYRNGFSRCRGTSFRPAATAHTSRYHHTGVSKDARTDSEAPLLICSAVVLSLAIRSGARHQRHYSAQHKSISYSMLSSHRSTHVYRLLIITHQLVAVIYALLWLSSLVAIPYRFSTCMSVTDTISAKNLLESPATPTGDAPASWAFHGAARGRMKGR